MTGAEWFLIGWLSSNLVTLVIFEVVDAVIFRRNRKQNV